MCGFANTINEIRISEEFDNQLDDRNFQEMPCTVELVRLFLAFKACCHAISVTCGITTISQNFQAFLLISALQQRLKEY